MPRNPTHPYEWVELGHMGARQIDVKIVPLVKGLYDLGWYTTMSCQSNDGGKIWVEFDSPYYAECFMNFIMCQSKKLRGCVRNSAPSNYDKLPKKHRWVYPDRWYVDAHAHHGGWTTINSKIKISIRFPKKQLDEVTKIICKEAKRRKKANAKRKAKRS